MSWFSRGTSFSSELFEEEAKEQTRGRGTDENGRRDNSEQHFGPSGIKDDFSELTKTFTRQLLGVASFLAPPPHSTGSLQRSSIASSATCRCQFRADPLQINGSTLRNDLVYVDLQSVDESQRQTNQSLKISNGPHDCREMSQIVLGSTRISEQSSGNAFIGMSNDLAEFRGSVATGFSRIIKLVKEGVDLVEPGASFNEVELILDRDNADEATSSVQLSDINSSSKPLFGRGNNAVDLDKDIFLEEGFSPSRKDLSVSHLRLDDLSKFTSTLILGDVDSDEEDPSQLQEVHKAVGITDEVLAFARNISMHPETWLDFPLLTEDDDDYDEGFEMLDVHNEHIRQVEHVAPRLAALRIELCPGYMSEGCFWKIYFVLLHPRLSKIDANLLSTPQLMEARKLLLSKLQREEQGITGDLSKVSENAQAAGESFKIVSLQGAMEVPPQDFCQVEKSSKSRSLILSQNEHGEEIEYKTVLASTVKLAALPYEDDELDADKWLTEELSPNISSAAVLVGNDDDVSFSDLEEEDEMFMTKVIESKRFLRWAKLKETSQNGELLAIKPESQDTEANLVQSLSRYPGKKRQDVGTMPTFEDTILG